MVAHAHLHPGPGVLRSASPLIDRSLEKGL